MDCIIVPDAGNAQKLVSLGFRRRTRDTADGPVSVFIASPPLYEALMENLGEGDFYSDKNLCF